MAKGRIAEVFGPSTILVLAAHLLAGGAFLFWVFGTAILEEQEPGAFWVLLFPVLLTLPAIAAVLFVRRWKVVRSVVLWGAGLVLLAFSIVSGFSVGLYYMPAACVLVVAAGVDLSRQGSGTTRAG